MGIEIVRLARWSPVPVELPDPEMADIRLALLESHAAIPNSLPGWLIVRRAADLRATPTAQPTSAADEATLAVSAVMTEVDDA